jgi:hypothetical protein
LEEESDDSESSSIEEDDHELRPLPGSFNDHDHQDDENGLEEHAEFFRLRHYAERREQISRQWNQLNDQVVAAYLLCQQTTLNWTTTPPTDFTLPPGTCTCPSNHISMRRVDLLDILRKLILLKLFDY